MVSGLRGPKVSRLEDPEATDTHERLLHHPLGN